MIGWAGVVIEIQGDVVEEIFLIALGGEVVVGVALLDQIAGQFALGQQGIGGNGFAVDVDRIQQRDDGFDFVGLFFLIATGYGQRANFFWV